LPLHGLGGRALLGDQADPLDAGGASGPIAVGESGGLLLPARLRPALPTCWHRRAQAEARGVVDAEGVAALRQRIPALGRAGAKVLQRPLPRDDAGRGSGSPNEPQARLRPDLAEEIDWPCDAPGPGRIAELAGRTGERRAGHARPGAAAGIADGAWICIG